MRKNIAMISDWKFFIEYIVYATKCSGKSDRKTHLFWLLNEELVLCIFPLSNVIKVEHNDWNKCRLHQFPHPSVQLQLRWFSTTRELLWSFEMVHLRVSPHNSHDVSFLFLVAMGPQATATPFSALPHSGQCPIGITHWPKSSPFETRWFSLWLVAHSETPRGL